MISVPSNLGKGIIWYFLCPKTNKRYRILYSINGYFYHRKAFDKGMYESQRLSQMNKTFGAYFKVDNLYSQLYQKHFKKTYAGKPTKKYLKIMRYLKKSEHITFMNIKGMLFK